MSKDVPPIITAIGNMEILSNLLLALFCSARCPGDLILKTYDLARALRDAGIPVIGGFHSPMEKECLRLLLRGNQPVIVCPARSIHNMRIPSDWRRPLEQGRLLVLSPFEEKHRRITADLAAYRNEFVAALADAIFIAYAEQNGKTESFARSILDWGKSVLTFDDPDNANLIGVGAKPVSQETIFQLPGPTFVSSAMIRRPDVGFLVDKTDS